MGEIRNAYKNFVGNLKGRVHEGNLDVDWGIILKLIQKEQGVRVRTGFNSLRMCTNSGRL
jgi:hypothetical protein